MSDLRTGLDAAGQPREGVAEPHRRGIEGGLPRLAVPCVDSRSFPEELPLSLGGTNGSLGFRPLPDSLRGLILWSVLIYFLRL